MTTIWLLIVVPLVIFAVITMSATAAVSSGNRDRLAELMAAHERNLQSDDPSVVEASKVRWANMCQFLKQSHLTFRHGQALESFGRAAEAMFCKKTETIDA